MSLPVQKGEFWTLDFDIENRPSSYWYDGQSTAEVTGIAWAWTHAPSKVQVALLEPHKTEAEWEASMRKMLTEFADAYEQADMVTGHYIKSHDLPIINGALIEMGLPTLTQKLAQDTKNDLIKFSDLPKTQEHLADMLSVAANKVQMSQMRWRRANRITQEGMAFARNRAAGDVRQHMQLRKALLKAGLLHKPKVWRP